jgi:hypothetical protein
VVSRNSDLNRREKSLGDLGVVGLREAQDSGAARLASELERDGIALLPPLFDAEQLSGMQQAFAVRLRRLRWNNFEGYQKTELYRQMIEDVLTLDQGFVDAALHPLVKDVLTRYLGDKFELVEAKGWRSIPTKRNFHGWHGDAWYDQETIFEIPKEVKLAVYLTDVRSGAFNYIKGSHRQQHPRPVRDDELGDLSGREIVEMAGPAGTAFLFDTSGIHRQGVPMLEPRQAVFYNYHDPEVRLQKEDVDYYRYHPLLLNAAFLGGLSAEDQRILGFGNRTNYIPHFDRQSEPSSLYRAFSVALSAKLRVANLQERVVGRFNRTFRRK